KLETDVPSRFLRDIDPRYISDGTKQHWNSGTQRMRDLGTQRFMVPRIQGFRKLVSQGISDSREPEIPKPRNSETPNSLQPGTIIEHERFGIGTVIRVEGLGENTKATVEFRNLGTKQLLLKFARFRIVKA
ncbi:MAG: ATP-dependent DNA helicase, partial [Prevotellaceae bacterium]|nr:ATP-dependent DNA helicase [Prevotellaceae bacterium]